MYVLKVILLTLVLTTSHITSGYADEVTNIIKDALKQYKNGDYTESADNLDYASQLIRQKKQEQLQSFLPKPLDGWTAEDDISQAVGTSMLIGGTLSKRTYHKDSSIVTIEIIANSPMLQSIITLFNTPLIASASGGKLEIIKGQKAIVAYNPTDQQGEIRIIVAGRILITLKGTNVSKQDIIAYANNMDYKEITAFH
ncbi:MAG: hypothetical protein ACE5KZ_11825 [Candidatus Scalinduaceae bacterium]